MVEIIRPDKSYETRDLWSETQKDISFSNEPILYKELILNILQENKYLKQQLSKHQNQIEFLKNYLLKKIIGISQIKNVFVIDKDSCTVWVILKKLDPQIENEIYSLEYEIREKFDIKFEFLILLENPELKIPNYAEKIV